jgi:hypothetical protein
MPSHLRHFVVAAAQCSIGYTRREAFDQTEQRPLSLSLCQGSIVANLDALLAEPLPIADPVAASIRSLLDVGEPREYIVGAVAMWLDIPATTDLVEEAHGGGCELEARPHNVRGADLTRALGHPPDPRARPCLSVRPQDGEARGEFGTARGEEVAIVCVSDVL